MKFYVIATIKAEVEAKTNVDAVLIAQDALNWGHHNFKANDKFVDFERVDAWTVAPVLINILPLGILPLEVVNVIKTVPGVQLLTTVFRDYCAQCGSSNLDKFCNETWKCLDCDELISVSS